MSLREPRSWLFAPAIDGDLVEKALNSSADAVVLDLEDGTPPDRRSEARAILRALEPHIRGRRCQVRISQEESGYAREDVLAAIEVGARAIRVPKAGDASAIRSLSDYLDAEDPVASVDLYLTVESARGLLALTDLTAASHRVRGVVFGEHDYAADLGVSAAGPLSDYARAHIANLSRAADLRAPIDGAYVGIDDDNGLRDACLRARQYGFGGKSAIHPRQLTTIHEVFSPTAQEIDNAHAELREFQDAVREGRSVATLDGRLVDRATVRRAQAIIDNS